MANYFCYHYIAWNGWVINKNKLPDAISVFVFVLGLELSALANYCSTDVCIMLIIQSNLSLYSVNQRNSWCCVSILMFILCKVLYIRFKCWRRNLFIQKYNFWIFKVGFLQPWTIYLCTSCFIPLLDLYVFQHTFLFFWFRWFDSLFGQMWVCMLSGPDHKVERWKKLFCLWLPRSLKNLTVK